MTTPKEPARPTIGRTVILRGLEANGSVLQPAIITRVLGEYGVNLYVNLMVLPDAGVPHSRPYVPFFFTRAAAEAADDPISCYWPDIV